MKIIEYPHPSLMDGTDIHLLNDSFPTMGIDDRAALRHSLNHLMKRPAIY